MTHERRKTPRLTHGRRRTPPGAPRRAPDVSVVIPTLNEALNLPHVFEALPAGLHQVVLVDGGSTDGTVEVARQLRPDVVVVQQTRTGKGNALATGFAACTGDAIAMIDADGSTDPAEIHRFIEALTDGAEFAKGSRFAKGGHSHDITPLRRVGNEGLNFVVNRLFGTRFTDLCYGYNAFWRRAVPVMDLPPTDLPRPADGSKLWGDGFEIETLINIRVAASGMRVKEVSSIEHLRIHGTSNLDTFRDGARVLRTIVSEFRRRTAQRRAAAKAATRPAGSAERVRTVPVLTVPGGSWHGTVDALLTSESESRNAADESEIRG
ncbi:glycosyltransferase family 2 protein [Jidongwangia harbinensis]|uniref:glycosyltransferase family 2 protein n=1 Tax=Jidongwangia harbinensis TaxID=2878561 RepID=UPI001CDA1E61|nr:glycosyltransferase family 2 protein [Jidongwangia harbinensis]MCA2219224.1 glycosyltransferase family 2 protein [Jidongwangia harbinensis]